MLLSTAEGRATYDREFKDAPLLFDGKKRNARGEDGADRYNGERLEQLSRESYLPTLAFVPCTSVQRTQSLIA